MNLLFVALTENTSIRGVERYCYEYVYNIKQKHPDFSVTMLIGSWQEYFLPLKEKGVKFRYAPCNNSKFSRHLYLIFGIKEIASQYNNIHYCNTLPYFFKNETPTTVAIHDLAEYFVPHKYGSLQLLYRKLISRVTAWRADHITTLSDYSKKTICQKLRINQSKVTRIYPGVDHLKTNKPFSLNSETNKKAPYFLYYGAIERAKGIQPMLEAFALAKKKGKISDNTKFHLVGKPANAMNDIESFMERSDVVFHGFVEDSDLIELISSASAVVLLSEYEGFGLPAVEAFLFNDNILASSTTSLGEVTKDFAWQIDPLNIQGISNLYGEILTKPHIFNEKEKAAILKKYTWSGAVGELLEVFKGLKNKQNHI